MHDFSNLIASFPERRLVVIGDLMLDEYILGEAERIRQKRRYPSCAFVTLLYRPAAPEMSRAISPPWEPR